MNFVSKRYLDNMLKNPKEDKYRRIKQGNKVFQVCVFEYLLHIGT